LCQRNPAWRIDYSGEQQGQGISFSKLVCQASSGDEAELRTRRTQQGLVDGIAHDCTLVLPAATKVGTGFAPVGDLLRVEADEVIIGYAFDLKTNALSPEKIKNPMAGKQHAFRAWRVEGQQGDNVSMRAPEAIAEMTPDELDDEQ